MNFSLGKLQAYCENQSTQPSALLNDLERETYLKTLAPQMISGALQGRLLSFISHMVQAHRILEIGTFTGYGTLCLAEGLGPDGTITTIESNPEYEAIYRPYFAQSIYNEKINCIVGDALRVLKGEEDNNMDILFVDAGKRDYEMYFNLGLSKVKKSGIMIFDNVLWSGKVVMKEKDIDTQAIHEFNMKIKADIRVRQLILPIRDGLMILIKL